MYQKPASSDKSDRQRYNVTHHHQIPAISELAELGRRFVAWSNIPDRETGKPRKMPFDPATGHGANSTDPATWGTLEEAMAMADERRLEGIGFVLDAARDGIVGVDLDGCRDPENGTIAAWAREILDNIRSYSEVSPSGTGVKIFARCDPVPVINRHVLTIAKHEPKKFEQLELLKKKSAQVELYSTARYFALTGEHLEGTPDEITDATEAIERLARRMADAEAKSRPNGKAHGDTSASGLDASLACKLAREGKDDEAIRAALLAHEHGQVGPNGTKKGAAAERAIRLVLELAAKHRPAARSVEWPDPAPLPDGLPPVMAFELEMLPDQLRPWITDVAERMQVPPDFPAVGAMIALAAVVGRQIGIRPKGLDDWAAVPNLWGAIVGRPGLMKTPALTEALRPLMALEQAARLDHERALEEFEAQTVIEVERRKVKAEKVRKHIKDGHSDSHIKAELLKDKEQEEPAQARFIVNDATVEKLGLILAENPRGILQYRDELMGWLRGLERDGREQDRSFYLESWNGDGTFTYDRIGRGTIYIDPATVSVLGSIQPGPLLSYLQSSTRGGAADDGLLQRFQLIVWPDVSKTWANVDRAPDRAARAVVVKLFERLAAIDARAVGAFREAGDPVPTLRFDPAARVAFDRWRAALEHRLRGDLHPAFESHLAKYRSLLPSLALLCHLADGCTGQVGIVSFARAEAWVEYLESHARRVYDALLRADLAAARTLGEHILTGTLISPFTLRDVYRRGWSGLSDLEAARAAIEVLVDLDWLRAEDVEQIGRGRPSTRYHHNPKLKTTAAGGAT